MKHSLLALLLFVVTSRAEDPIAIGLRRELFADRLLIEKMEGASLRMHAPQPAGVALKFDQPWEGRFSAYITVIHDEPAAKFRMYYRGNTGFADGTSGECTCYAESEDGIRWARPKLGLYEINGSKDNNVMLTNMPPFTHNFAPFLDRRPGVPADERYEAFAGLGGKFGGLCAFVSGDGIHWQKMQDASVITKGAFDLQNISFWSEAEQCYAAYFRIFTGGGTDEKTWKPIGVRWVSRATSKDFIHWSDATPMTSDQPLFDHIYISQTQPYFRAQHLYVATAARFMQGKAVLDAEQKAHPLRVANDRVGVVALAVAGLRDRAGCAFRVELRDVNVGGSAAVEFLAAEFEGVGEFAGEEAVAFPIGRDAETVVYRGARADAAPEQLDVGIEVA